MDFRRIFESLGLTGSKWQWRAMRWQNQWDGWTESWRQQRRQVTYQNKFCNSCGALMKRDEKVCPHCQAPAPNWNAQVVQRALGLVLPQWNPVTTLVLGANVINYLLIMVLFGPENFFRPQPGVLPRMGALIPPAVVYLGQYWRVITYGYLHFGIIHIGFNLFALSQVGPFLEEEIGSARFFVLYTVTLVGAIIPDMMVGRSVVGASGALFGLIGFGMSYAHFFGGAPGRLQRNFFLRWAIYGFLFGFMVPGIDNLAHFGGFITGAVFGYVIAKERRSPVRLTSHWTRLAYLCLIATVLSFAWMFTSG